MNQMLVLSNSVQKKFIETWSGDHSVRSKGESRDIIPGRQRSRTKKVSNPALSAPGNHRHHHDKDSHLFSSWARQEPPLKLDQNPATPPRKAARSIGIWMNQED